VSALVGGRQYEMLVDTGASISITNLPLPTPNKMMYLTGIGGTKTPASLSETTLVQIHNLYIPMRFYVCQNNEGTIMGNDLMNEYEVPIDCGKGNLIWPDQDGRKDWIGLVYCHVYRSTVKSFFPSIQTDQKRP